MYSSFGIRKIVSTLVFELAIHQRHLEFEFEIGDGAQTANDGAGLSRDGESTSKPSNGATRTLSMLSTASCRQSSRSSSVKSGCF